MSDFYSLAFYNLENLINPKEKNILDTDYSEVGKFQWTEDKYLQKIENLAKVISRIGFNSSQLPPVLAGVCEVGHEKCLKDLIQSEYLKPYGYDYVFHESDDSRGMNVALLYQKSHFSVKDKRAYSLPALDNESEKTRDILKVSGSLFGNEIHILINHWPSRTDGTQKTNRRRLMASALTQKIVNDISKKESCSNTIIMGDFNDDPGSKSIMDLMANGFINPLAQIQRPKFGTVRFKGKWLVFDQILFNQSLKDEKWFRFESAHIFIEPYLIQKSGKHKGSPKRTFNGSYYQGGYSDHFPVFIYFSKT